MMLDEMLRLNINAGYMKSTRPVTVIFHTSKLPCQGSLNLMIISGVRSMDITVAKHATDVAAIRYMESAVNTSYCFSLSLNSVRQ